TLSDSWVAAFVQLPGTVSKRGQAPAQVSQMTAIMAIQAGASPLFETVPNYPACLQTPSRSVMLPGVWAESSTFLSPGGTCHETLHDLPCSDHRHVVGGCDGLCFRPE